MEKRTMAFAVAMSMTATIHVDAEVYQKLREEIKESIIAVVDDEDGTLWGEVVSRSNRSLTEQGYHLIGDVWEETGGDLEASVDLVFYRGYCASVRQQAKEQFETEQDLTHVQVSVKLTPKSSTIINQTKKEA